jgi:hypothetical protein
VTNEETSGCETRTVQKVAQLHGCWVVVVEELAVVVMTDVEDTVMIWGSTYASMQDQDGTFVPP